ncbi:MAG: bifunctional lysylphosphatidylglycerol flippase/synthetase MprF [Oryzihumus sp.]
MARTGALLRQAPLTVALAVVALVVGVVTGSLWSPLAGRPLRADLAFGLPSLEQGRWWTPVTGAVLALEPVQYLPILVGLLALGGFAEVRLGTGRYATALVASHLVGVLGTAGLLALARGHGYGYADGLARQTDAGMSAGFLGAAAAATATLRPPWRGRVRVLLAAYPLVSLAHVGALFDVEHTLAVLFGLALGPVLLGRRPHLTWRQLTRRDYRLLASGLFVLAAVEGLVTAVAPGGGPLFATLSVQQKHEELANADTLLGASIQAVLWLWLARSLYKGRRVAWRWAVALVGLAMLAQVAGLVYLAVRHLPGWPAGLYELLGNGIGLAALVVGRRAFRNPSRRRARRTAGSLLSPAHEDQRAAATELLQHEGTVNRLAWMTTWPENRWFTDQRSTGYVAYRVHAGVALGLCDPVAAREADREQLLGAFADTAHAAGLVPCLFTVTAETARHALAHGWHALQVAEEAVIDLPRLEFTGKAWQDVRTALNQAAKLGITFRVGPLSEQPRGLQLQVKAISSEWVEDKGLSEMGFTLGGVDEALDPQVRVGLAVDADSTVHGLTSWMPICAPGGGAPVGWTLDVMRRLPGGFRYSMEFLIASACMAFREEGATTVSLSGAPLARAAPPGGAAETGGSDVAQEPGPDRNALDAFLDRLGQTLEPYYGFRSLQAFKTKFQPRFEPLYLVFPDEAALPRIGLALSRAYLPDAGVRDLVTLARSGH